MRGNYVLENSNERKLYRICKVKDIKEDYTLEK